MAEEHGQDNTDDMTRNPKRRNSRRMTTGITEPTKEQIEQGRKVSAWVMDAINLSGKSARALAIAAGFSPTYLYLLRDGGVDTANGGMYKRPSVDKITTLANAVAPGNIDFLNQGLIAAGYMPQGAPPVVGSHLLNGLPPESLQAFSRFLSSLPNVVSPLSPAEIINIPIIGTVSAGTPILGYQNVIGRAPIPRSMISRYDPEQCFAVRVKGDCLEGLHIIDGDLLICRIANNARDRDVVVVTSDEGEVVAKRYREGEPWGVPTTLDHNHKWLETVPILGTGEVVRLNGIPRIIGVQVAMYREAR